MLSLYQTALVALLGSVTATYGREYACTCSSFRVVYMFLVPLAFILRHSSNFNVKHIHTRLWRALSQTMPSAKTYVYPSSPACINFPVKCDFEKEDGVDYHGNDMERCGRRNSLDALM